MHHAARKPALPLLAPTPDAPDSAVTLLRNLSASDADGVKIETMRLALLDLAEQQKATNERAREGTAMAQEAVVAATAVATSQREMADDVRAIRASVGELYEVTGRLLAELAASRQAEAASRAFEIEARKRFGMRDVVVAAGGAAGTVAYKLAELLLGG